MIRMGIRNLSRRKARTALTVIGVVIGTISIVVMVSIGIGMNQNFQQQVMQLGSLTTITVTSQAYVADDKNNYQQVNQVLNDKLIKTVEAMDHVKAVIPFRQSQMTLYCKKYECGITVNAIDFSKLDALDLPTPTYGEIPTSTEKDAIIMGGSVPEQFYNPKSTSWQPFTYVPDKMKLTAAITDYNYTMADGKTPVKERVGKICVLTATGGYEGYDWNVYVDLATYNRWYNDFLKTLKPADVRKAKLALQKYSQLIIQVDDVRNVKTIQDSLSGMGFQTSSLTSMMEPMQKTSRMLQMVLGAVGAVAMLVSAISIANTMIMSIYERTKEIGVMKVLGCKLRDIRRLFLFESAIIGLMGGVIGNAISYFASFLLNKFGAPIFSALMSGSDMGLSTGPVKYSVIPFWLPFAAAAFAMAVGLVSGYYPANRATKISAIEAMKSED